MFASSVLTLPQTAGALFKDNRYFGPMLRALQWGEPLYTLLYAIGIIFFAYFYVSIVFNPTEVADNMRKYGGFIPGIRPGARTANYINDILTRITLVGALYLILISFIPEWMIAGIRYRLAGKVIKGQPLGGTQDQWVVIEPAYRAAELAEQLHDDPPGRRAAARQVRLPRPLQVVPRLGERPVRATARTRLHPR